MNYKSFQRARGHDRPSTQAAKPHGVRTTLVSRNIVVNGRRTSVRLENDMWVALMDIAARESRSINDLATLVEQAKKTETSLTAALRVFIMGYFRAAATEDGHRAAGHGAGTPFDSVIRRARLDQQGPQRRSA